jgi:uridine monophosphate synthetase
MATFLEKLESRVQEADSLVCIGLDPYPEELPDVSKLAVQTSRALQMSKAAQDYCLRLIEATADVAAAFKPNIAFFEAYGPKGISALQEVIAAIPARVPVILDAKRGDIASTASAYAQAAFQTLETDAITVNPLLGKDSLAPFIGNPEKGAFLLCKTSNPGSADFQDLSVIGEKGQPPLTIYETIARLAQDWNANKNIGLVVGATYPEALARVRALAPDLWILSPGVGPQGGDLQATLQAGLRPDGMGVLISTSRSIARAPSPRQAAIDLRDAINRTRQAIREKAAAPPLPGALPPLLAPIADGLLDTGCIRFGQFTLKSGASSPIYIDLRQLVSYPGLLAQVAAAYMPILRGLSFDRLAAIPYAAIPIATAISLQSGWSLIYPRKEAKAYGTMSDIEGAFKPGEQVVLIDDLATTGGSKVEAIEKLNAAGLKVEDVVVLVNRQSGATGMLKQSGFRLHAVLSLSQLLDYWERSGKVLASEIATVRLFLQR